MEFSANNSKIISQPVNPRMGIFWKCLIEESENSLSKTLESWMIDIIGGMFMHNFPTRLNGV
jgi:hypothetical protein